MVARGAAPSRSDKPAPGMQPAQRFLQARFSRQRRRLCLLAREAGVRRLPDARRTPKASPLHLVQVPRAALPLSAFSSPKATPPSRPNGPLQPKPRAREWRSHEQRPGIRPAAKRILGGGDSAASAETRLPLPPQLSTTSPAPVRAPAHRKPHPPHESQQILRPPRKPHSPRSNRHLSCLLIPLSARASRAPDRTSAPRAGVVGGTHARDAPQTHANAPRRHRVHALVALPRVALAQPRHTLPQRPHRLPRRDDRCSRARPRQRPHQARLVDRKTRRRLAHHLRQRRDAHLSPHRAA